MSLVYNLCCFEYGGRTRRRPICSRSTRFSSIRYSITCCCLWFSQPERETTRNENGSRPARIRAAYHPRPLRTSSPRRIELLDLTPLSTMLVVGAVVGERG